MILFYSELKYVPVILTGDLNAEPQSPVYDFIARGILKYENTSLRSNYVAGKALIPSSLMITGMLRHILLLKFQRLTAKHTFFFVFAKIDIIH